MKTAHYPFVLIAGFFGLGIMLNQAAGEYFGVICMASVMALTAGILFSDKALPSTVFLFLAITGSGIIYTQSRQFLDQDHITHVARYYRKGPVAVRGVVASDKEARRAVNGVKTTFTLEVRAVRAPWGWENNKGKVLVNVFRDLNIAYGDYVQLEGKLHRPFEFSKDTTFSYRDYLSRKGIRLIFSVKKDGYVNVMETDQGNSLKALSLKMKSRLNGVLFKYLSKNEAAIMQAVLLGDRYNIPNHIRDLFRHCGVSHILAISGLHLGVVAFLVFLFLKMIPMPRRLRYASVIVFLAFYALLTGGRPSVVRATIMVSVFLASFIVERESGIYNTMSLAALIILLINPLNLFDAGFQLSFVSVFSIVYFYPKFMTVFSGWDLKTKPALMRYFTQSFVVSLAAFIGVAGLIAYYFHIITPVAIFANLFVIPLISAVIALGMGLLFVGIILSPAAFPFAACLKMALNVMVALVFLFDKIPHAYFYVTGVNAGHMAAYYSMFALWIVNPFGRIWRIFIPNGLQRFTEMLRRN